MLLLGEVAMKTPNDRQWTRQWLLGVLALVLAIACFPVVNWAVPKLMRGEFSRAADHRTRSARADASAAPFKTRSANRPPPGPRATHGPRQWRDFFLPAQEITGLTLAEALNQLRTAYETTCRETGEVPRQVTFKLPADNATRIRLKLGRRTLESSVHLLAAISRLAVQRHGREYRFTAPVDQPGRHSTDSLQTLGLGHQLDVNLSDTSGDVDDATGEASITERVAIQSNGFSGDSATRVQVQTRPDGSRAVLLVTPTLIDPTGRPARTGEKP